MNSLVREDVLIEKIRQLSEAKQLEVEDFIDFLSQRTQDQELSQLAMQSSEAAFATVWDNPDDAVYDDL
jgi:hypothetical protein